MVVVVVVVVAAVVVFSSSPKNARAALTRSETPNHSLASRSLQLESVQIELPLKRYKINEKNLLTKFFSRLMWIL